MTEKPSKIALLKKLFSFEEESLPSEDLEFMSDVDAAYARRGSAWAYRLTLLLICIFFVCFILSFFIEREEVTKGDGTIIFSRGVQPIQSLDGGILIQLLVKENEIVEAGTILAKISNTASRAEYQDLLNKESDYTLSLKRLRAERDGEAPDFTEEERKKFPFAVRDQLRIFDAHKDKNSGDEKELNALLEQKRLEVESSQSTRRSTEKSLLLLKQQEEQIRPLVSKGVYSEIEYLKLKQRIVSQESYLNGLAQTIGKAQSAVREAESKLANLDPERLAKIANEMNDTSQNLRAVKEALVSRESRVDRSDLKAPIRGIVKRILLKEDSVVRQAETVMELLPLGDSLEIEAKFRPEDRGFIAVGQNATIKISAFDFAIYGGLSAVVENISGDTIEDSKGRPWYAVRLKTSNSTLPGKEDLDVKVGMTVTVDVFSGKKTLFNYLMKPLVKSKVASNVVSNAINTTNATDKTKVDAQSVFEQQEAR